ncbi:6-bladed beta-propeller [Phocaeicola sp.]
MKLLNLLCLLPFMASCGSGHSDTEGLLSADLREQIKHPSKVALQDEIESVEYIPLETTGDPASLLDGVSEYALTSKYIYISPVKEQRIVQFDRKGRFVKTLIPFGQGPGEFSNMLVGMQADEKKNRLYLFCANQIGVYTLDGEFIENLMHEYPIVYQRMVGDDRLASVAFPYVPFQAGSYGLGIFTGKGDTIAVKNDFSSPLVSPAKRGLTIGLAVTYSEQQNTLLFKMGANDTVFRVSGEKIFPACVLKLQNSDKEVVRSLDATDFSSLREKFGGDGDIFVSDLFETPQSYYFRCRYNRGNYVASVDKKTGKALAEKCVQPEDIFKLSGANLLFGMLGTRSYNDFPIWGRMDGEELVQLITPYELSLYEGREGVSVPDELKGVNEDSNPVFIVYKLRKN